MPIFLFQSKTSTPAEQVDFDPLDRDTWEELLSPQVLETAAAAGAETETEIKAFKDGSKALSALEFPEDAPSRREIFAKQAWGLILDVDDKVVLSFDQLKERLDGIQFTCFSSFSSTLETPRWRVVLPFKTPAPVSYSRSIWDYINEAGFEGLLKGTRDPTRLGFIGRVRGPRELAAYTWYFNEAPCLDWEALRDGGLLKEVLPSLESLDVQLTRERRPHWTSRSEALAEAIEFYTAQAVNVKRGGRHGVLFRATCALWWDWAAEDEEFVYQALSAMNATFEEPKDDSDVWSEVVAGYRRTIEGMGPVQVGDYGNKREPPAPFSAEGAKNLAESLKQRAGRTRNPVYRAKLSMASEMLKRAVDKKALCERDQIPFLSEVFAALGEAFSRNPAPQLANFLEPSLAILRGRYPHEAVSLSAKVVTARITHHQQAYLARKERQEEEKEEARREELREVFNGARDWGYTKAELEEARDKSGLTDRTWLLQHRRDYYIYFNGTYVGPKQEKEIAVMADRYALPMPEIKTRIINEKGAIKFRSVEELMREYGSVLDSAELDYNVTHSKVHRRDGDLILSVAAGRRVPLTSKYSQDIDQWLRLLSGAKYNLFLDYLAAFTETEHAIPCLFLYGPTGTGKSSFAKGLSRLYRRGEPLPYEHATARFNHGLKDTPVILCDERIPDSVKKSGQTTAIFRNYIQKTDHLVELKNGEILVLRGAIRMMITANNLSVLTDDKELLSNLDVDGTINRFLLLEADPHTKEFLESFSAERFQEVIDVDLARHVIWLNENRVLDKSKRFLGIEDPDKLQLKSSIVTTKEVPNLLCELIVSAILNPRPVMGMKFTEGGVYVRQELWNKAGWERLGLEAPKMPQGSLSRNMALLTTGRKAFWEKGKTVNYREVDLHAIFQWAKDSDFVEESELEEAITKKTQEAEVLNGTNPTAKGPEEAQ